MNEENKISKLICEILELSQESEVKVTAAIKELGIRNFFLNAHVLNISQEEINGILALKEVIEVKEQEYQKYEGGDKCGN